MKVITVRTFCSVSFFVPPEVDYVLVASLFVRAVSDAFYCAALPIETVTDVRELSGSGWFFFCCRFMPQQNPPLCLTAACEGRDVYVTNKCYKPDVFL